MNSGSHWSKMAAGFIFSVPGAELLKGLSVNGGLVAGLASAAYRLKEGESVWLSAPFLSSDEIISVANYFHQVRLLAIGGALRANAFNRPAMISKTDLVIWTKASFQFSKFRTDRQLGAQWLRLNNVDSPVVTQDDRILRTLLCQPTGSLTALCDEMLKSVSPFLIIINMTPFGLREDLEELLDHVESFFPSVPKLLLTNNSDLVVETMLVQRSYMHWRQQQHDPIDWIGGTQLNTQLRLIIIPDETMDNRLWKILNDCGNLKLNLKNYPSHAKLVIPAIHRAIRALRCLSYPLNFHENYYSANRRGGLFPVMPLKDWLDKARRASLPTGQAENSRDLIVNELEELLFELESGKCGKEQALNKWIEQYLQLGKRSLIVVGSKSDADAMRGWLLQVASNSMNDGTLEIVGVNSARDLHLRLNGKRFDHALVVSALWETDMWILSIAERVDWLGYPGENRWQQQIAVRWSSTQQADENCKAEWWNMDAVEPGFTRPPGDSAPNEIWSECTGQYSRFNSICVGVPSNPDWITALIESHLDIRDDYSSPASGEVTVITESELIYRYHHNQRVYTLVGDSGRECLEFVKAKDLIPGTVIVELRDQEDGSRTIFETLIEYALDNYIEHKAHQALVERWYSFIDHALHRCGGIVNFHKQLQILGIEIGMQQLKNWTLHNVIGPSNASQVITAIAQLSGIVFNEKDINSIVNAQSSIKGLHSTMGKRVKQIVAASFAPGTTVSAEFNLEFDESLVADLVNIEMIKSVHSHPFDV